MSKKSQRIFIEDALDVELFFESLSVASSKDKELLFVDRMISYLRLDPYAEVATLCSKILVDLECIDIPSLVPNKHNI
jgi:hypothetical protein